MLVDCGRIRPLRPIRCEDEGLLRQFVRELSPQSRQRRFLASLAELPPNLSRTLSCVDGVRHVAFVIEERDGDGAEIALTVADAWQGMGLGSRLLAELLATARRDGVRTVHGQLLRDNRPAARLLKRHGFSLEPHPDDPVLLRAVLHNESGRAAAAALAPIA
jgi:acetyltransferase